MSLTVYAINGVTPVVDPTAYVHPSAVLIGDVIVGAGCYIGPCASLRDVIPVAKLHLARDFTADSGRSSGSSIRLRSGST
jgi:hypothetical protein